MNKFLNEIFKEIIGRDFNPNQSADRKSMQMLVYLLQSQGIAVGKDYNFMWLKNRPHSIALQHDIILQEESN